LGVTTLISTYEGCDLTRDNLETYAFVGGQVTGFPTAPIPDSYLLIKAGLCARTDLPPSSGAGYYRELHLIAPGSDQLLGAYFRRQIADPAIPPVAVLSSWLSQFTEEPDSDMTKFLVDTLGIRLKATRRACILGEHGKCWDEPATPATSPPS